MKRLLLSGALGFLAMVGCKCSCKSSASIHVMDGGQDGGGGLGGPDGGSLDGGDGTETLKVPPGGFRLDGGSGEQGSGVTQDPNGNLVLSSGAAELHFMWIANSAHDWVSKYDTRTGKEVGRYFSVIPKDCAGSAGPPCAAGVVHGLQPNSPSTGANSPSRTAIDLFGDVWVANRAPMRQGSVTKVANDEASCIDRNGDGVIQTSRDLNGDGQISPDAADKEMIVPSDPADPNQYDECVLFTTTVAAVSAEISARALAISGGMEGSPGEVWVGIYSDRRFYKLHPANGQVVAQTDPLPFGPYGAIVDRNQRLWAVAPGVAQLALIDTASATILAPDLQPPAGTACGAYALGVDGKNRIWLPGWSAGTLACRYDHSTGTWTSFSFTGTVCDNGVEYGRPRGIAVDEAGIVYMSADNNSLGTAAQLLRFDGETGAILKLGPHDCVDATDANTRISIGTGLDGDGQPWVNNASGNVMKVDTATGAVTKTTQQEAGLYTYSDFTGYQLRRFTAPRGTYSKDFEGCPAESEWRTLRWDGQAPPPTALKAFVKTGATQAALSSSGALRYGPFTSSPVDLVAAGVPKSSWLRVEFELSTTDGATTPVLKSFELTYSCGGIN